MSEKTGACICIDLKSFFASVECVERGLDPMTCNLVVADPVRTEKTICLAASPAIKKLGVPNRCRLFQIPKHIKFITAPPRMQLYINYSMKVYNIYLKYFSPEDIHVYSVDEVFIDATHYLSLYRLPVKELAKIILKDIYDSLGLSATCGIGTNLYLAKIALDILAKRSPDFIGMLDEDSYKKQLWDHRPLTDFWMVGKGTRKRLEGIGIYTMRDIAMSDENLLFRLFGVNAELLMDHAWGIEPTTIGDIKRYRTKSESISSGQVLMRDYNWTDCRLIVKEMCDLLCLELVSKHKVTDNISLTLGYTYGIDRKPISSSRTLTVRTSSNRILGEAMIKLYDEIADRDIYYRRVYIGFNNLQGEEMEQTDLFTGLRIMEKDRKLQEAAIEIKTKYGKNALLKGMNLEKAGTTVERNAQIGGHRSSALPQEGDETLQRPEEQS
ncbi:MAG: DNA repair protein [Lachnospiraceae bacterium]